MVKATNMDRLNVPRRPARRQRDVSPALSDTTGSIYKRSLNSPDYQIRLLELYKPTSASSNHRFKCRLRYGKLSDNVPYSALSYRWGDMSHKVDLFVDGQLIAVSRNLAAALNQLWRMGEKLIWVDMLCINQADHVERSGQVRMMGMIYSGAEQVFMWLGPSNDDSAVAMQILGASGIPVVDVPEDLDDICDAVIQLFSRRYFGRMWIIQEVCKARHPIVVCGSQFVAYSTMLERLDNLGHSAPARYAMHLFSPLRTMRRRTRDLLKRSKGLGLLELLILSRKSQCLDPRDKLFGLYALASDAQDIVLTIDYSQSVERVFINATKRWIGAVDRIDVILLAHRTRGSKALPSWVPDWSNVRSRPPAWIERLLNASRPSVYGKDAAKCKDDKLIISGTQIEKIVRVFDSRSNPCEAEGGGFVERQPTAADRPDISRSVAKVLEAGLSLDVKSGPDSIDCLRAFAELCRRQPPTELQESPLALWLVQLGKCKVGQKTIYEHIGSYLGRDRRNISTESLIKARADLQRGFNNLARGKMAFVTTDGGSLWLAYKDAKVGDQIWELRDVSLPVVLRRTQQNCYCFIGEAHLSNEEIPINRRTKDLVLAIV